MSIKFTNNFASPISSGIAAGDTSITLAAGYGAQLPSYGGGDYEYMTLADSANHLEIVKVTARAGDTLTVVRGQDNTAARAWIAGDIINSRPCAAAMYDALAVNAAKAGAGVNTDITKLQGLTTPITVAQGGTGANNADDARQNLGIPFSNYASKVANYTVTDADAGKYIYQNSTVAAALTFTLPSAASVEAGFVVSLGNHDTVYSLNVVSNGADTIRTVDGTDTSLVIAPLENITLMRLSSTAWVAVAGTRSSVGGGGSSLPSQTGNSGKYLKTDGSVASWEALSSTGIGVSQTWQNVAASRNLNTNYQNSTGAPIMVSVDLLHDTNSGYYGIGSLYVGVNTGSYVLVARTYVGEMMSAIVPAGHYYKVADTHAGSSVSAWSELR